MFPLQFAPIDDDDGVVNNSPIADDTQNTNTNAKTMLFIFALVP